MQSITPRFFIESLTTHAIRLNVRSSQCDAQSPMLPKRRFRWSTVYPSQTTRLGTIALRKMRLEHVLFNCMPPKRRFWKELQKIKRAFPRVFSRVESASENPPFIFCSVFQNLRLGSINCPKLRHRWKWRIFWDVVVHRRIPLGSARVLPIVHREILAVVRVAHIRHGRPLVFEVALALDGGARRTPA